MSGVQSSSPETDPEVTMAHWRCGDINLGTNVRMSPGVMVASDESKIATVNRTVQPADVWIESIGPTRQSKGGINVVIYAVSPMPGTGGDQKRIKKESLGFSSPDSVESGTQPESFPADRITEQPNSSGRQNRSVTGPGTDPDSSDQSSTRRGFRDSQPDPGTQRSSGRSQPSRRIASFQPKPGYPRSAPVLQQDSPAGIKGIYNEFGVLFPRSEPEQFYGRELTIAA